MPIASASIPPATTAVPRCAVRRRNACRRSSANACMRILQPASLVRLNPESRIPSPDNFGWTYRRSPHHSKYSGRRRRYRSQGAQTGGGSRESDSLRRRSREYGCRRHPERTRRRSFARVARANSHKSHRQSEAQARTAHCSEAQAPLHEPHAPEDVLNRRSRRSSFKHSRFEFAHLRVTTPHSPTNDLKSVIAIDALIRVQNSSRD